MSKQKRKKQGGQNGHKGKTLTRKDVEKMLAEGSCEYKVEDVGKNEGEGLKESIKKKEEEMKEKYKD